MSKYGFFIKRLELSGSAVETKSIQFKKGLNVIFGSSDTGKTFIFQCINYMLGGSTPPKPIPESENYNLVGLVIETYEGKEYKLERSLQGGDFNLYDSLTEDERVLAVSNQSKSETISSFLLNVCNINGKKIRRNKQGKIQNLYFQNLKKYFAVDEVEIVTEKSLLTTGQYIEKTFDMNTLRFLLTEEDDSSIISSLEVDSMGFKKGKLELYNELISQLNEDLKDSEYQKIDEQIEKLDDSIKNYKEIYLSSKSELNKYDNEKDILVKAIYIQENELINKQEILTRAQLLRKQYICDIARLKATLEAGQYLDDTQTTNCPMCDSNIKEIVNIPELTMATNAEIMKINLLLRELEESQKIYTSEKDEIDNILESNKKHLNEIVIKIQDEIKVFLEDLSKNIKIYSDKKQELSRVKTLKEKLDEYVQKRDAINVTDKKKAASKVVFQELTSALMAPIVQEIEDILKAISFDNPQNPKIGFSETLLDFVIGTKNRKDYGKGYRAILYASFVIALLQYFRNKSFQIGFVLIDSPLNPYKADSDKDDGEVPNNLAHNFYKYLYENVKNEQVILIENTPLSTELKKFVNYYEFTRENGFLPKLLDVEMKVNI
ncbi:AAA family ATPase [Aliarcobacter butzleri]|uniref:AAA family ATPase n=1 Tax=Aliarcobacter butzleri TaxID=28197 RepID=UPI002B24F094|nr:AAA family ATPase [Aliarcobacter butzleri]